MLKKIMVKALLWGMLLGGSYGIGIISYHFDLPPLPQLKEEISFTADPWSIGIYTGKTPFSLKDPDHIQNPVLVPSDVTDIDAGFVADPFLWKTDSIYYMFLEVLNKKDGKGDLSYATSKDGIKWKYQSKIIDEKFHLSYPQVFSWKDDIYMVPESHEDRSVRLYKATHFPDKWEYVENLLEGQHFTDPTLVFHDEKWWLFVSNEQMDVLQLYYSENLTGPWVIHPESPIVTGNKHISRPAGRILEYNNKLYRFAQDCSPVYGKQVFAFEIERMTSLEYSEKAYSQDPILSNGKEEWNKRGMHQVDIIPLGDSEWMSVVDGY